MPKNVGAFVGLLYLLASLSAGVLSLTWIYSAARNAHVLADGLKVSPPWAVGSTLRFLIHSPARMFHQFEIRNERFKFTFATRPGPAPERGCKYCVTDAEKDAPDSESPTEQQRGVS